MASRKLRDPVRLRTVVYYRGTQIKAHTRTIPYQQALRELGGDAGVAEGRLRSKEPIRRTRTISAVKVELTYTCVYKVELESRRLGAEALRMSPSAVRGGVVL